MSPIGELSGSQRIALEVSTGEGEVIEAKAGGAPSPTKTTPKTREDAPIRRMVETLDLAEFCSNDFIGFTFQISANNKMVKF